MVVRLLVLVAVVLAGCGPSMDGEGAPSSPSTTSRFSPIPRAEAEAMVKRWVDGLAHAVLPDADWKFEPAGTEGGYGATGCTDDTAQMTPYHEVPYSAKTPLPPGDDERTAAAILDRAEAYLEAEGFTVTRGGAKLRFGVLNGTRDGFNVGIQLPRPTRLVLPVGTTPCVK